MTAQFEASALTSLEGDIVQLIEEANAQAVRFMETLRHGWLDGTNRFDRAGETYLLIRRDGHLVGAGGLNRDPYCDVPGTGRIRHIYVSPAARRRGVGRFLLGQLVGHARGNFDRLRLRTNTAEGAAFYEAFGFARCDEPATTHLLKL